MDMQYHSSSDNPYLHGILSYRHQIGNRSGIYQSGRLWKQHCTPLSAMLIDVPHQLTKHQPETQQNSPPPLDSSNGTEHTVSTNSSQNGIKPNVLTAYSSSPPTELNFEFDSDENPFKAPIEFRVPNVPPEVDMQSTSLNIPTELPN